MSPSTPLITPKAKTFSLGDWWVAFLSIALALLLTSCGGGGTSGASTSDSIGTSDPTLPPAANPNTSTNVSPGVYTALWIDPSDKITKTITSVVMQTSTTSPVSAQFYALYFNSPSDPDIYSGSLSGIGSNSAVINSLGYFQNGTGTLRTGTATLTVPEAGRLDTSVSYASMSTDGPRSWSANPESSLKQDTPAAISSIQGKWTGRWSYAYGFAENFTVNISDTGTVSSFMTFQSDCQITNGNVAPAIGGVNLFNLSFNVPNATQCFVKGQSLTGAAYITRSTIPGKTQQLQWVATAPSGRGISFRADR